MSPEFEESRCKGCGKDVAMSRNTLDENGLFCIRCRIADKHTEKQRHEEWVRSRRTYLERELAALDQEDLG